MNKKWEIVVKKCQRLFSLIEKNFTRTVEARIRLGKLLLKIDKEYGGRVIEKLAATVSEKIGYTVHPQRLYEYMKVAKKN